MLFSHRYLIKQFVLSNTEKQLSFEYIYYTLMSNAHGLKVLLEAKGQLNSDEFMRSSVLPKWQPKITRISALPSNKLPGQKSW